MDKNLYVNDLIHRYPNHTFTETVVGSRTQVEFKDSESVVIGESIKMVVLDAYRSIRLDLLIAQNPEYVCTTIERDALVSINMGTEIYNITESQNQVYSGSGWVAAGGETGGIIHIAPASVQTTENTETVLLTLPLADDSVYLITAEIIGETTDHSVVAGFIIECTAQRNGGGSATIEGGTTVTHSGKGNGAASWSVDFTISGNDLRVSVTGQNATTINWETSVNFLKF